MANSLFHRTFGLRDSEKSEGAQGPKSQIIVDAIIMAKMRTFVYHCNRFFTTENDLITQTGLI